MAKPNGIVNWDALAEISHPFLPPKDDPNAKGAKHKGLGGWDKIATFYNQVSLLEEEGTLNQIDCFEVSKEDTVLDICCGTGRSSVPLAKRAKSVTAVDASAAMLAYCMENAEIAGVDNITTVHLDFADEESRKQLTKHDIVLTSRSIGLGYIDELCELANKMVVFVSWAYGEPTIPSVMNQIFEGCYLEGAETHQPRKLDRRLGNNLLYNQIYDRGYEPNLRIVPDGFKKTFASRELAYADLYSLGKNVDPAKTDRYRANVDRMLIANPDGTFTFEAKTKSLVIWWEV